MSPPRGIDPTTHAIMSENSHVYQMLMYSGVSVC